jgi:hypothetical protein
MLAVGGRTADMLEHPPAEYKNFKKKRALNNFKLGRYLMEKERPAEAVPVLERSAKDCHRLEGFEGLKDVKWGVDELLLQALKASKQTKKLLAAVQSIVRSYENRVNEGSCSERSS